MKCLMKHQWVKLPRNHLPEGKGIMNAWAKLASRAAFRKGQASYCGHIGIIPSNFVDFSEIFRRIFVVGRKFRQEQTTKCCIMSNFTAL